ncbi:MAG: tRNA (guanosine(37)-N1)-methyltransferase TrmD [Actinobacteria bacterium]|nr:tRNA (guanosine(37)-N1)-methyltransferase TrmD [Actinomycetota bacterium]
MRIDIISIFPDYLAPLGLSLIGKAIDSGTVELFVHDLRDHATGVHRTVDDTVFGGGPGMVMKPEPWAATLDELLEGGPPDTRPILLIPTPSGRHFTQAVADELATSEWLIFGCGRYEGIDGRVAEFYRGLMDVRQVSIGDYVLAGGEAAALVICEAVVRLVPGVVGNASSAPDDSFAAGRCGSALEGPVYTKPASWRGLEVPPVLLSGHHGEIAKYRQQSSAQRTGEYRPDLVEEQ